MDSRKLTGALKAAILIHCLGREASDGILKHLTEAEQEIVYHHLTQVSNVPPEVAEYVAKEFADRARRAKLTYTPSPARQAPKAKHHSEATDEPQESQGLEALLSLGADDIYELIKEEHPQVVAIILIHIDTQVASEVLSKLPDEIKTDVALRIAGLDKVLSNMVDEVNEVFKEILKSKKTSVAKVKRGVDRIAEMLNLADDISSELILSEIEENNPELAAQIKQKMFTFEDLILVDDRGCQKLLRKVETVELAIALKAASEDVKEKVFRNMSQRAGEMLREEMEALGPVRMKEVADAQQNITNIIQEMESKGEIIIGGRRGEEIVA
jgi:flagellar motor switch protein FliG